MTISAGTLEVSGPLGGGAYGGDIGNAGSLLFDAASNQSLSGVISGTGSLTQAEQQLADARWSQHPPPALSRFLTAR